MQEPEIALGNESIIDSRLLWINLKQLRQSISAELYTALIGMTSIYFVRTILKLLKLTNQYLFCEITLQYEAVHNVLELKSLAHVILLHIYPL